MSRQITIELDDTIAHQLEEIANKRGSRVEEMAEMAVSQFVQKQILATSPLLAPQQDRLAQLERKYLRGKLERRRSIRDARIDFSGIEEDAKRVFGTDDPVEIINIVRGKAVCAD